MVIALSTTLASGVVAARADSSPVSSTTETRPATVRVGDGDHNFLVFVNKSRGDLCTSERIAYEHEFEAWLNGGEVGPPPAEPASSQQGVAPVTFTSRVQGPRSTLSIDGQNLPVEVWRRDNQDGGIDCTATDGPGAALFATGTMSWNFRAFTSPTVSTSNAIFAGRVTDTEGRPYRYSIHFIFTAPDHQNPNFHSVIQLVPLG